MYTNTVCVLIYTAEIKKGHTLQYLVGLPLALITAHTRCDILSTSPCNVITFISFSCINVPQDLVLVNGDLDNSTKFSPARPKDSQWISGLDSVVANPCVKIMSHAPSETTLTI